MLWIILYYLFIVYLKYYIEIKNKIIFIILMM